MDDKSPTIPELAGFHRLLLYVQEEHTKKLERLTNAESGYSFSRCSEHTKAIENFRRLQYIGIGIMSALTIIVPLVQPIVIPTLKKLLGV